MIVRHLAERARYESKSVRMRVVACNSLLDHSIYKIPTPPPFVCAEILDERETLEEAMETLADYETMGVENIWLIDITNSRGDTYKQRQLHPAHKDVLSSADGKVVLNPTPIFENLRQ